MPVLILLFAVYLITGLVRFPLLAILRAPLLLLPPLLLRLLLGWVAHPVLLILLLILLVLLLALLALCTVLSLLAGSHVSLLFTRRNCLHLLGTWRMLFMVGLRGCKVVGLHLLDD